MQQNLLLFNDDRKVYTLRELSDGIRKSLEAKFTNIWLSGEIAGVKTVGSGHCYFLLKDADVQIKCVCWKMTYYRLKFKPKDGVQAVLRGRVDIYEGRSEYQFVVEMVEPQGEGALQIAFEAFKKRLLAEGLFDQARKKPLPKFPRRIGVVSSPTGAAIHDFIEVLTRRFPGVEIRLFPARVQGVGSAEDVRRGIDYFGQSNWAEVLVLARGGGSLEDLWTFNEESVARAIAASPVPVVSAIGHETDFTIADLVADLRAPTPSAAAAMILISRDEILDQIANLRNKLVQNMRYRTSMLARRLQEQAISRATTLLNRSISRRAQRVDELEERLKSAIRAKLVAQERRRRLFKEKLQFYDLRPRLGRDRARLSGAEFRVATAMRLLLNKRKQVLGKLTAELSQLDPRLVLDRGYSIVIDQAGRVVREAANIPPGTDIKLLFARSEAKAKTIG